MMISLYNDLIEFQDLKYADFTRKLNPTVAPDSVIGIRVPVLRKYAKAFAKDDRKEEFLNSLPHKYYEENMLHMFVLESEKDFDECCEKLEKFLPYADSWSITDGYTSKVFDKNKKKLFDKIIKWTKAEDTYTIRFGLVNLMKNYLDEDFSPECNEIAAAVVSEEYYVNMMVAWYFATALAKQYESTISYIEDKKLSDWVHNKTIQKAIESNRITDEQKSYLKSLKVK